MGEIEYVDDAEDQGEPDATRKSVIAEVSPLNNCAATRFASKPLLPVMMAGPRRTGAGRAPHSYFLWPCGRRGSPPPRG